MHSRNVARRVEGLEIPDGGTKGTRNQQGHNSINNNFYLPDIWPKHFVCIVINVAKVDIIIIMPIYP